MIIPITEEWVDFFMDRLKYCYFRFVMLIWRILKLILFIPPFEVITCIYIYMYICGLCLMIIVNTTIFKYQTKENASKKLLPCHRLRIVWYMDKHILDAILLKNWHEREMCHHAARCECGLFELCYQFSSPFNFVIWERLTEWQILKPSTGH